VDGLNLFSMDLLLPLLVGMGAIFLIRMMPRFMAGGTPFVPVTDLKARMDRGEDLLVLDVRTPKEFSSKHGHVPGALNLPLTDLPMRLRDSGADLAAFVDTPIFIMCQTSSRAAHAARALKKAGFRNLSVVSGGMQSWRGHGHPTRQG
jgi:rhodanese-related sulfurtransferase